MKRVLLLLSLVTVLVSNRVACAQSLPQRASPRDLAPATLPSGFAEQVVVTGLHSATGMAVSRDGRIFVCEQTGSLRVVKNGRLLDEPFLTVPVDSHWERGLIGVALHPDFPDTPYVYVCYVAASPFPQHRVSRFTAEGDRVAAGSERILLRGDDQRRLGGSVPAGHQGGGLAFGPDGMLYLGLGEQTAGTPSQRLDSLLGKVLRLAPDGSIPPDNPFAGQAVGKYRSIWARGLRNPFALAFQPSTGRLLINDVGSSRFEEINLGRAGGNYGWPHNEGPVDSPEYLAPLYAYAANPQSISGGVFYEPPTAQFPSRYVGKYFFADYIHNRIRVLDPDFPHDVAEFASQLAGPVALAVAPDGSLYCLNRNAWVRDDRFEAGPTGSLHRYFYAAGGRSAAPRIVEYPREWFAAEGSRAVLHVRAEGENLRFEWERNGERIDSSPSGGAEWVIDRVRRRDHGSVFRCRISNGHGTVSTQPISLWVEPLVAAQGTAAAHNEPGFRVTVLDRSDTAAPLDSGPAASAHRDPVPRTNIGNNERLPGRVGDLLAGDGWFHAEHDGIYHVRGRSPHPLRLHVAAREVLVTAGAAGTWADGVIGLKAGRHRVEWLRPRGSNADTVDVEVRSPGRSWEPLEDHLQRPYLEETRETRRLTGVPHNVGRDPELLPRLLSETGLFRSLATLEPVRGMRPYEVNAPLWSDGARKRRWMALPAGASIDFDPHKPWAFPAGTVFVKHFEWGVGDDRPARRLETRILVVNRGDAWGATYRWRTDGSDAELLDDRVLGQIEMHDASGRPQAREWYFPSRDDCRVCHTPASGFVLGVNTSQLNRAVWDEEDAASLAGWQAGGVFGESLNDAGFEDWPRLAGLDESQASLSDRARSYLASNCAPCHRPGGVRGGFDARFETPLTRQGLIHGLLQADHFGEPDARLVVPGDPDRSMIVQRMRRRRDVYNMPPLATAVADEGAIAVLEEWIRRMDDEGR